MRSCRGEGASPPASSHSIWWGTAVAGTSKPPRHAADLVTRMISAIFAHVTVGMSARTSASSGVSVSSASDTRSAASSRSSRSAAPSKPDDAAVGLGLAAAGLDPSGACAIESL